MKSRKIRTFIPEDTSLYANPYISFPAERNIDNTKSSFDLRYNKNYKVNSKRVFTISSEYRDIDRAIKPDLLHPSTLDRILTMENQDGTTACVDLLNQTDKKYQHKRSKPKKHYYAVTKTATIAADIGIPTSEEAKVTKVLATSPMQLEKMLFKDYYGTRVGRKNSPPELHMIYNFDNWLQVRVYKEDSDKVVGQTIYYYNPSEMRPLEMNAFAKTIWTQKSVYVPVRFGTDVVPLQPSSSSTAITSTPVNINASLEDWQKGFEDKIFGRLNELSSQYQQQTAQQAQQAQPDQQAQPVQQAQQSIPDGVIDYVTVTVGGVRSILKNINWGKLYVNGKKEFNSFDRKCDEFLAECRSKNWSPAAIINAFEITNKNDIRTLQNLCEEYLANGHNEDFWNIVKKSRVIGSENLISYEFHPSNHPSQQPVEQPVEQPVQQPATQAQQAVQQPAQTPEQSQPAQSVFTDQQQPATQQEQPQQDEQTSNVVHIDNMQDPDLSYDEYMNLLYTCFDNLFTSGFVQNKFNDFVNTNYPSYKRGNVYESAVLILNEIPEKINSILNGFFKILEKDIDKLNNDQQNAFYNAMVYVKKLPTARHTQTTHKTTTAF